jgi:hypothetical protein
MDTTDKVPRWPQGDIKHPSHFELEAQGWRRGDWPYKTCERCGQPCEWWIKPQDERGNWTLFNKRTTQLHQETCGLEAGD